MTESIILEHRQCLIAGDGNLPIEMAKSASRNGFEIVCISLSGDNLKELKKYCSKEFMINSADIS